WDKMEQLSPKIVHGGPGKARMSLYTTTEALPNRSDRGISIRGLISLGLLLLAGVTRAAVIAPGSPAPTQDPLMALMLSQPRIDTTSPVSVTATFDPPIIGVGQSSTYRVVFNALEESIEWPDRLSGPANMSLQPGAHGQILQMAGNVLVPQTTFNTRV